MLPFKVIRVWAQSTRVQPKGKIVAVQELAKERVEFATRREQFEEAFRLVYQEYFKKGYCPQNPSNMRVSIYNTLPDTVTFCLWRKNTLLGTASLIFDSPLGLPMECVYPEEVQALRKAGRRLCEVSLLALNSQVISKGIRPIYFAERLRCLYQIFKPIFWYARDTAQITDLCIAMNPIHKFLYSSLYFEQFGDERIYESVNGNPSIAMRLTFDNIEGRAKKTPGLFKLFLGKKLELRKISEFFRWNQDDFSYFFTQVSDVLKDAKPEYIEHLSHNYPELPIKQMAQHLGVPSVSPAVLSEDAIDDKNMTSADSISNTSLSAPASLKAKYQDGAGKTHNIRIRNLSRGGLCIEDEIKLPIGTSLRLLLNIKNKAIEAQGEVAWATKTGPPYLYGIKFTFMEQKGREWFNTFVMDRAAEQVAEELDFSGLATVPTEGEIERRSFARLKIPLRADVGFNEDTMLLQAQIYDLSEGGLCLISSFELKKGQELNLKIWLSDKEYVYLTGLIKYTVKKKHEDRHVTFHGIEFTRLEKTQVERIARFLKEKRSELAAIEISLDDILTQTNLPEIL